jgi:bacteriocin resistance YdeI/OmpD-like protein/uncharacterized protein DUF1905
MTFTATALPRPRGGISIPLPFDPAEAWGERDRYYLTGRVGGYPMRGSVTPRDGSADLALGPSWCHDPRVGPGALLEVSLEPEGPQIETIAPDLADALTAEPAARRAFEALATHYRKGFVTWVESARRPVTRTKRIAATIAALNAGQREP